jgi:prepilin-type N-terminal cleavage/methylation domain-containing protein
MIKNKQKGFTIIEVALVLAVAALIFLVVFLAVPALQRNQRDDARKRDVGNVVQAVTNATANENKQLTVGIAYNGGTPTDTATKSPLYTYLDTMSNSVDYVGVLAGPTAAAGLTLLATQNTDATTVAANANVTTARINAIVVYTAAKCKDNGNAIVVPAPKRSSAVVVQLENGGTGKYYCQNAN